MLLLALFLTVISCTTEINTSISDNTKLALRDVGHRLLLSSQDSISLVKPVIVLTDYKYQLTFENTLTIHPDSLVAFIKSSFKKANLPVHYLTEVLNCKDQEVAYSYQMKQNIENGIIPCGGRVLHRGCYLITVKFTKTTLNNSSNKLLIGISILAFLGLLLFFFLRQKPKELVEVKQGNYTFIGSYKFYPEQNKLIKEATEINLSKKECEILSIFIERPNQIIKREELSKKVWEDHGVIVGRSLDTYISKLRKKLQEDPNIKLTNVHGVGYKLEL